MGVSVPVNQVCPLVFTWFQMLVQTLHQLLGLEEAFQVLHLPDPSDDEDERLCDGPPEDALVGALAGHTEALLAILRKHKAEKSCKPRQT